MLWANIHAHTQQGVVQQLLPFKSVCSQVGNSLVTVPAFQKSQVTAAQHVQVSSSAGRPAWQTRNELGTQIWKAISMFMTPPSEESHSQPKTGSVCMHQSTVGQKHKGPYSNEYKSTFYNLCLQVHVSLRWQINQAQCWVPGKKGFYLVPGLVVLHRTHCMSTRVGEPFQCSTVHHTAPGAK